MKTKNRCHFSFLQKRIEVTKKNRKDDIEQILRKLSLQQFKSNVFFLDNTCTESVAFNEIWETIENVKEDQSQWNMDIPAEFIELEKYVRRPDVGPVIKFKRLLERSTEAELFVKYMKASGFILTLKASGHIPADDIVVNPQWLIDHYRKVINHSKSATEDGKITEKYVKTILGSHSDIILAFMENLGLIAKPQTEKSKEFFIPSLGKEMNQKKFAEWLDIKYRNVSKTVTLDYRKNGRHIPFPHFDKLMTDIFSDPPLGQLYEVARNGCIVLMSDGPLGYFLCHGSSIVKITMFTNSLDEKMTQNENQCTKVVGKIIQISKHIGRRFNQYLQENPQLGLSCDPFPPRGEKFYVKVEKLMQNCANINCCGPRCKKWKKGDLTELEGNYTWGVQ